MSSKISTKVLRLAIPKKGRLREPTLKLIEQAGYSFSLNGDELYAKCTNENLELIFLRTEDIPVLVEKGVVDAGITGSDNVAEKQAKLSEMLNLNFGECRLSLAAPVHRIGITIEKLRKNNTKPGSSNTLKVATSFPTLTKKFFHHHSIKAEIITLSGSIEIMIALKVADYVVDLVQSGNTLRDNHLKIVDNIGSYYTALYTKTSLGKDPRITKLTKRLEGIIIANRYSILEFNIDKKLLAQAEKIAPGFDAPTISHLDNPHKVAVKVLTEKSKVNAVIEKLHELGATGIFETAIKNCRP